MSSGMKFNCFRILMVLYLKIHFLFQEFARLHKSEYKTIVAKVKAAREEDSTKEKDESA